MNKLCMVIAGLFLLAAANALADDANVVRTHNLEVIERLGHLERIDVTAEKSASAEAEPLDDELLAILEEVESVEDTGHAATGSR
jgi:hypothetical protein